MPGFDTTNTLASFAAIATVGRVPLSSRAKHLIYFSARQRRGVVHVVAGSDPDARLRQETSGER